MKIYVYVCRCVYSAVSEIIFSAYLIGKEKKKQVPEKLNGSAKFLVLYFWTFLYQVWTQYL